MKKLIAFILIFVLTMSLAACGGGETSQGTPAPSDSTPVEQQQKPEDAYFFVLEGVKLIPGAVFDAELLPEANDVFQVPSCAIEGTDDVYSYDAAEITAYNDGTGPVIYSIYLLDPNVATEEGLLLGDDLAQVETLCGTEYQDMDGELVYTKGATELRIILEDDVVVSIEYRMVTE